MTPAFSLIVVRGFANLNVPKFLTAKSLISRFPMDSVRASPPGYTLTIRPLPMTVINPPIGVSGFVMSRCTCIHNLRSSDSRCALHWLALLAQPLVHMTILYDLHPTPSGFGGFNVMLMRSRDPRWVPVIYLSTVLFPVAKNLPPVLLTIGVAPRS